MEKTHKTTEIWEQRAKEIYAFYLTQLVKTGKSPTLEEIGAKFGFSRARAGQIMERLAKDGYVVKLARRNNPYIPNFITGFGTKGKIVDLEK